MNIVEWARVSSQKLSVRQIKEGDSLLLSTLAYFHWDGCEGMSLSQVFETMADDYARLLGNIHYDDYLELFSAVAHSPRFADVLVADYQERFDESTSCQFASVLFHLGDGLYYAMRGTDGTLVGWKEDLDLLYNSNLASQSLARDFLDGYAVRYPDLPIVVGGHSKGGNLAEYAGIFCHPSTQDRVLAVYNHDGPGFLEGMVEDSPERARVAKRIAKTVPAYSVFGLMLNRAEPYEIVKADTEGIWQHYPFHWRVEESGKFERTYRLDSKAILIRNIIETMLPTMPPSERMIFVHTLYQALRAAEVERVGDIKSMQTVMRMIKFNRTLPKDTKSTLWQMFFRLLSVIAKESVSGSYRQPKPKRVRKMRSPKAIATKYRVLHARDGDEHKDKTSKVFKSKAVKPVKGDKPPKAQKSKPKATKPVPQKDAQPQPDKKRKKVKSTHLKE